MTLKSECNYNIPQYLQAPHCPVMKRIDKNSPIFFTLKETEIINASTNCSSNWNASSSGNLTTRVPNQVIGEAWLRAEERGCGFFANLCLLSSREKKWFDENMFSIMAKIGGDKNLKIKTTTHVPNQVIEQAWGGAEYMLHIHVYFYSYNSFDTPTVVYIILLAD